MATPLIRIVTWNLQGRSSPDPGAVAEVLGAARPDVIALQEVQRGQARAVAGAMGWQSRWAFKHWPLVVPAEGLAILVPLPPSRISSVALAHRWTWWSWRRRIALVADLETAIGPLRVVDTHLGAHVDDDERARQAAAAADLVGARRGVVVGDLNAHPDDASLAPLDAAGLVDAWTQAGEGEGATNWEPGPRCAPPTQRLDYVFTAGDLEAIEAVVPAGAEAVALGWLSDHLPVTVTLGPRTA